MRPSLTRAGHAKRHMQCGSKVKHHSVKLWTTAQHAWHPCGADRNENGHQLPAGATMQSAHFVYFERGEDKEL